MDVDRVIHEPARLRIAMILSAVESADFKFLVSTLGLTKGNLNSHMDRLEKAGYVEVQKTFKGKTPHTAYRLTEEGRSALGEYWAVMDRIRETQGAGREPGSLVTSPLPV